MQQQSSPAGNSMPHTPKVSVVVPVYRVEKYLRQCVDSILAQTLTDIEVILVNDGSPDACPAMVDEYAARDSRVVAIHQPNGGYGKAVNTGIAAARAPYIGIVESDDYLAPEMYETLLNLAQQHNADVSKCWFYDLLEAKTKQHCRPFPFPNPPKEDCAFRISEYPQLLYMHPSVWTCLYRRDFLITNSIHMIEAPGAGWTDNPFQVQTMCRAKRIVFSNTPLYYWRRVNEEAADDLRDYRIPFDRSDEIHQWLTETGYATPEILANLYARELNYILIISRMKHIANMGDCCRRMHTMCCRMDKGLLRQAPLNRKNRKAYILCMLTPRILIWTRRFRRWFKERKNT